MTSDSSDSTIDATDVSAADDSETDVSPPSATSDAPLSEAPLRSVHTSNLPELLHEAFASVLVTTYQAGKLVILRNEQGVLNTHFRSFIKPMGLAIQGPKLAIGTQVDIWEFRNVPAVCPRLDEASVKSAQEQDAPPTATATERSSTSDAAELSETRSTNIPSSQGETASTSQGVLSRHDACFLPRCSHTTGDVQIHEMAWVGSDLWFVNTTFSCLATRSYEHSFEPRWRPPFVKKLIPGDCCHLNGLAVRDGRVRYVTALGTTNVPGGWRDDKRNGGVLMDVESNEIVVQRLSMPHSPRWYRDQLWLLESGDGSFGRVDLQTGRYEAIAQLPGFTRGLSFMGPLALIGLSQVRESAIFSGFPLVERLSERTCGVWVVHIETGQTVGFVRFEDAVQEIFAVEVLWGARFPDLINHDFELIGRSYVLPDEALRDVPPELRSE